MARHLLWYVYGEKDRASHIEKPCRRLVCLKNRIWICFRKRIKFRNIQFIAEIVYRIWNDWKRIDIFCRKELNLPNTKSNFFYIYYRNVVILSEESYNNLMENAHILGTKANYDWLMESKAQLERGQFAKHDLIEVGDE